MEKLVTALIAYCFIRECIFVYYTHRLLNKLMSRNYYEYQLAEQVGKAPKKAESQPEIKEELIDDPSDIIAF